MEVAPERISARLLRTVDHPERADEVVDLMTEGFMENPFWLWAFGEDEAFRKKALAFVNRARVQLYGARSEFWLDSAGRVEGHVVMSAESGMSPSFMTLVRAGFLSMPFRFGLRVFRRFNSLVDEMKAQQAEVLGSEPDYWTLEAFVVRADCRGKGIGSRVLKELLEERVPPGKRIILMTQEEANVNLYCRHDFEIISEAVSCENSAKNWIMERKARLS
eukprot:CAMPEP_0115196194 /NCGR_PEP_ID=MMETSP0270-20121206/14962_1 /TAXON_ID=71861 /ORGANISM="Scrippsiella trochoidea, Strain CCMP3099" /LENGTH=218 /DNA_ID=CAMNT_0002609523 /DNA_START=57 /DNA_END=713 /DNA_ORIENTATION=+